MCTNSVCFISDHNLQANFPEKKTYIEFCTITITINIKYYSMASLNQIFGHFGYTNFSFQSYIIFLTFYNILQPCTNLYGMYLFNPWIFSIRVAFDTYFYSSVLAFIYLLISFCYKYTMNIAALRISLCIYL